MAQTAASPKKVESLTDEQKALRHWLVPLRPELETLVLPANNEAANSIPWTIPASSLLTPTAFGASWGDLFLSLGTQDRRRFGDTSFDVSGGGGFGIGNARRWAGIEFSYSMYDVTLLLPWKAAGALNIKVHSLFKYGIAAALGSVDLVQWNGGDTGRTFYGVVSKSFVLSPNENAAFSLILVHLGLGNGNYQKQSDIMAGRNVFNLFGSIGIRIAKPVSLVVNWYGSDLGIGISIAPFRRYRIVFTPNIQDVTGSAGSGIRYMLAMSFADNWRSPNFILR